MKLAQGTLNKTVKYAVVLPFNGSINFLNVPCKFFLYFYHTNLVKNLFLRGIISGYSVNTLVF